MKKILVLAAAAVALATPALAQQAQTPEQREARFVAADTNKDGKLDKAEFKASIPEQMRAQITDEQLDQFFGMRDADKDGSISKAEFTAPMQRPQ